MFSIGIGVGSLLSEKMLKGEISATYVPVGARSMAGFIFFFCIFSFGIEPPTELIGIWDFLGNLQNWFILISLFLIALAGGVYIVPLYAIVQHRCDPARRSRIIAANNIMNALFMVLAAVISMGLIALGVSILQLFLIVGIGNLVIGRYMRHLHRS